MNSISIYVFVEKNKEKHPIYLSRKTSCSEKHVDLLLIEEKGKRHYFLVRDFNTFKNDHTLNCGKKVVIIVYKLLELQKYQKLTLNIALKLKQNKGLRCIREVNKVDSQLNQH